MSFYGDTAIYVPEHQLYIPSREECDQWWQSLSTPFSPSAEQLPIHFDPYRFKLIAGGERGGKSKTAAMFALPRTLDMDLLWIVAKDYKQSRAEIQYLYDAYLELGLLAPNSTIPRSEHQPAVVHTTTGLTIRSVTAADPSKLGMVAPDGIIVAESAQIDYSTMLRLRGRLAEKRGWLLLEGTFEEASEWYEDVWEAWLGGTTASEKSYSLPTWSNTAIFPGGRNDPEILAIEAKFRDSPGLFEMRHGGIPRVPLDAVFPEFSHARHVIQRPFNPEWDVELAIDPGYAGAYAVLAIQRESSSVYVVDEVYETKKEARDVIKITREKPWFRNVNKEAAGVIDIAARQHNAGKSQLELWAAPPRLGGAGIKLASQSVPIEDGTEVLRGFLTGSNASTPEPRLFYNADSTKRSVSEYKRYKYPKDQAGRPIREKPIDRDNHSIKAIIYYLVYKYGFTGRKRIRRNRSVQYGAGLVSDSEKPFGTYPGKPSVGSLGRSNRRPRRSRAYTFG